VPKIVRNDTLNEHYIEYTIEVPEIASHSEPGQLLEVSMSARSVAVPHAIADTDPGKGTVTIVTRLAEAFRIGPLSDNIVLRGPFGLRTVATGIGKVICVADGLGVAALFPRLREYKANDVYTIVIAGFQSSEFVYWVDRLDSVSDELYVITDDGSYGIKGPIKNTIRGVCEQDLDIDRAVAIGSLDLLKTCCDITSKYAVPTVVSLTAMLTEDALSITDASCAPEDRTFDWTTASDLDGHKIDFGELTQKLGNQMAK